MTERAPTMVVTEGYFGLFGIEATIGRGFVGGDTKPGAASVVVLGNTYWRTRFSADEGVVGQTLRLNGEPAMIVGVLPAGFQPETSMWRPLIEPSMRAAASTYARLRPGVDPATAAEALVPLLRSSSTHVRVLRLLEPVSSRHTRTGLVLAGAVGLVLLISCINVSGLLTARGMARRSELAIRASLGAGRIRLVRQFLTESLVLAAASGVLGVAFAWLTLDLLVSIVPMASPTTRLSLLAAREPAIDANALIVSVGLVIFSTIVSGVAPALRFSRRRTLARMASSHRSGLSLSRRTGQALVALEVAMTLVVLVAAALMGRTLARLTSVELGFDPSTFFTVEVVPAEGDSVARLQFYHGFVQTLRRLPEVEAVGAVDQVPLSDEGLDVDDGRPDLDVSISTSRALLPGSGIVTSRRVLPGYFEALGLPVVLGRTLNDADVTGQSVALLNETAARKWFEGNPVGQEVSLGTTRTIVGVVADIRSQGPSRDVEPTAYVPASADSIDPASVAESDLTVVVRPRNGARVAASQLREVAESLGVPVAVGRIQSGSDWYSHRTAAPRQRAVLLGSLAALAFLLALVGVFSATAFSVARRTREIGVRMAFGARPVQVVRAIVGDAAGPVGIGLAAGLAGAMAITRVIESFLFDTQPTDPVALTVAATGLAAAALLAAWIPARRAARVDPCAALRAE